MAILGPRAQAATLTARHVAPVPTSLRGAAWQPATPASPTVVTCARTGTAWAAMWHHLPDRGQATLTATPCPRRDAGAACGVS